LSEAVMRALVTAANSGVQRGKGRELARDLHARIVQHADHFMRAKPGEYVPLSALCEATAVNPRQLQRAFNEDMRAALHAIKSSVGCISREHFSAIRHASRRLRTSRSRSDSMTWVDLRRPMQRYLANRRPSPSREFVRPFRSTSA
jgi:hypothetical protein